MTGHKPLLCESGQHDGHNLANIGGQKLAEAFCEGKASQAIA